MRILKATYPLSERGLSLTLVQDLVIDERPNWLRLVGGNGVGKTSFLEKILIPELKSQKVPFLYLGQDLRTQLYTIKALLAVSGQDCISDDIPELLTRWMDRHRRVRIFILDEFDKYPAYTQHVYRISRDFIQTFVVVSHGDAPLKPGAPFEPRELQFREVAGDPPLKQVHIEETAPW